VFCKRQLPLRRMTVEEAQRRRIVFVELSRPYFRRDRAIRMPVHAARDCHAVRSHLREYRSRQRHSAELVLPPEFITLP